jgi:hypothetical protein
MRNTVGALVLLGFVFGVGGQVFGIEILEPKEGAIFAPGETVTVNARPSPGEKVRLIDFYSNLRHEGSEPMDFIPPYEWDFTLPKEHVGVVKIFADGAPVKGSDSVPVKRASVTITVVLPPTTTIQSIGAGFAGSKQAFLDIARKPSRELVITDGTSSTRELSVGAAYSDGIRRRIVGNPDLTYESMDEKVAKVFAPGQWETTEDDRRVPYALVQATGPGKTEIIVRYKGHESRVTVHVKECPYIDGVTDKEGCPF